jgi:HSP20 family protein
MPGAESKDIDVKFEGNLVSISSMKVEQNQEMKDGEHVIRRGRDTGSVSRAFSLASEIDERAVADEYRDGVLSLTLPKRAPSERKRLQIN